MISIENLKKSYGSQALFENISFRINNRERVGLVGRNGHGKTTLLRLVIGDEKADGGIISAPSGYRIRYVRQHLNFTEDTVLEEGMTGLPEDEKDHFWKVEKILAGLGFSGKDIHRHPGEFSGGYQVRLNLAKALVSEPDLLLLDEPTNYLDITSIRWVERFLVNWPHELILVTHDRSFMDTVATHIVGIHRCKVRKIEGNTEKYYAQIAQDEEVYEKTRINDEKRRKEIGLFISRFRAKARLANMVQSRVKTLAKLAKKEKLETLGELDFSFRSKPFHSKNVMNVENVCFSYNPGDPLIRKLSFVLHDNDRVCVVGQNGKGKTTLLKLLSQTLTPESGTITCHPGITKGVFEQTNISRLVDSRTVEEEILYTHPDVDRQISRNICGAMMFSGDAALKKISVLSGGEKSRVMLGKLLVTPVNLLLLDEPSNHLDMESADSLLAAIDSFDGVVIMVTHNEMFLHALAKRLIVFQDERVAVFEGTYQEFIEKGGWKDEVVHIKSEQKDIGNAESGEKLSRKAIRKMRSELVTRRAKVLKPMEQRISQIEDEIESLETDLETYNQQMVDASQAKDGNKIAELSRDIHTSRTSIDTFFDELEKLTGSLEEEKSIFDEKFEQLESSG